MRHFCPNYWQEYQCDWTIQYLWQWMHWIARLDVIVLGAMLLYVFVTVIYVSYRCHTAYLGHDPGSESSLRELVCGLNIRIRNLKTIATIAPYMGFLGTCQGIMFSFRGVAMEKHTALVMVTLSLGASVVPSIAGILVAPPSIWAHNFLRARLERLERELPKREKGRSSFRTAQRLPLATRFSTVPWMFVAAPIFGILILVFANFAVYRGATGLQARLAPLYRYEETSERSIILRLANDGKIFLNQEQEDWNKLKPRLESIYRMRVHRRIYVAAEDDVRFQAVADAVDLAQSAGVDVELVTPSVMRNHRAEPRGPTTQFSK